MLKKEFLCHVNMKIYIKIPKKFYKFIRTLVAERLTTFGFFYWPDLKYNAKTKMYTFSQKFSDGSKKENDISIPVNRLEEWNGEMKYNLDYF